MKKIFETIKDNLLFAGISFSDFERMFSCLPVKTTSYKKNDVIMLAGNAIDFIGLILAGSVQIVREDIDGQIAILAELGVSETFGEVFACSGVDHSPVTVLAKENTEIIQLDYKRAISSCTAACKFHLRLVENMLKLIAHKNLILSQKNEILSKRTTRAKLFAFFDMHRGAAKKFTIPFNREELAHYLCVDRSAMSNELCKMRNAGLIKFNRNAFEIL